MEQLEVEFSRLFPVDKCRAHGMDERIEANEEELDALAKRMDVIAIKSLKATMHIQRSSLGEMVEVKGRFVANVVQNCGVTLEPFEAEVSEEFISYFAEPSTIPNSEEVQVDDDQSPEPILPNGDIDVGELTAQHLALAIDPHPRKPGVTFEIPEEVRAQPANPFAVLAEFRAKKKDK
jgi:uncharacterized metal-binding protein YceD (DUF177 family)